MESRLVWLAIGIFVGFVLWGDSKKYHFPVSLPPISDDGGMTEPQPGSGCSSCGGIF